MDMKPTIDFIIPVRDRDNKRIQNCIDSLGGSERNIIVIDYGSQTPVKVRGARILSCGEGAIWNKSYALNLGIKRAKADYICTVDCDMILHPDLIKESLKILDNNTFIYTLNTRRVEIKDLSEDFDTMLSKSKFWFAKESRTNLTNGANGGIQIYPRKWIEDIGGCDESLIYWGAMDNDTFERAVLTGLKMVNINLPLIHQEHEKKKEDNLPKEERIFASKVREMKITYLEKKFQTREIKRNNEGWGGEAPNQDFFLNKKGEIMKSYNLIADGIKEALGLGRNYFIKDGKKFFIQVMHAGP